jgi:hypothetical protein
MKKLITLFFFSFLFQAVHAQLSFQATAVPGPTANTIDVLLRTNTNFTGYLINVLFVVQLPETGTPQPVIGFENLAGNFTSAGYSQQTDVATNASTPGYNNYRISTGFNVNTTPFSLAAGTAYPLVRLSFAGSAVTIANVRIANLPSAGPTSTFQFYVEANATAPIELAGDFTNYNKMFYGTNSFPTAPFATEELGYAAYQYVEPASVLPVKWLGFSAVRQGSDVAVNWNVTNEEGVVGYDVEASTNGNAFSIVGAKARTAGNGSKTYAFVDKQASRYSSQVVYYRIRQNESNGTFSYSLVKTVRLDTKTPTALYPNPARDGFTLNISYLQPDQKRIQLQLVNNAGQVLETRTITRAQAVNYFYSLQPSVPSGDYLLKIFEDGVLSETKQVLIKR